MRKPTRRTETGRGERVVPGVWRLRLPLPWPGVPHCNAWALAAGDGIVLVDCGLHDARLDGPARARAWSRSGCGVEQVRLLVCTHAHIDHCGQAAAIQARTGCELWIHPRHEHLTAGDRETRAAAADRGRAPERRAGGAAAALGRAPPGGRRRHVGPARGRTRDLVPGVEVVTDHGAWQVHETPGHAPSHVVLHHAGRRLLISGDHVLGRISLYFDHGWTPDPVGEFLASLDVVDALDVRLSLSGHGRPFTDLHGHVEGNRALVARAARRGPGRARRRAARRPPSTSCRPSTARS